MRSERKVSAHSMRTRWLSVTSLMLASFSSVVVFQNCDRPYTLDLTDPTVEQSSLTLPVVVNEGKPLTNQRKLIVKLDREYAHEMNISFDPMCSGEWIPFAQETTKEWDGGDGYVEVYVS